MKMILKLFLGPVSNYYTFKKIKKNVILFNKNNNNNNNNNNNLFGRLWS